MKAFLITCIYLLLVTLAYAQDPKITSPSVSPSPGLVGGPVTVAIGFQNNSTTPIPFDAGNPTYISFTLVKITPNLTGNVPTVTGAGADFFSWTATLEANNTWTILGTQNKVIPGKPDPFTTIGGPISIPGTINAASTPAQASANNGDGFNANVIPSAGFDIDNSQESNNQALYGSTNGALPVTLTSFTATKEGQVAQLKWSTTAETNSDRFEIERSLNGKNWDLIGTQKSNGESTSLKNYTFSDAKPLNGENLYRLKMIDRDATFAYSRIQSLTFSSDLITSFYPNPVAEKLIIKTDDFSLVKNVKIFDANGRTVYQSSATPSNEINVQNLSAGLYVVQMVSKSGAVISHKVIKQ
ncbi:T9SS type A sorting domain-containing protein [Dyadobacter sp. 3J3]|uniref:T9SS type A sorting domain-containing protein n=1 Tax=Dyadobacter sp. 3J3 TaxID=2606600 RepID=UPI001357DF68|nr:T9SS type A sorting domain-containing protein [Dyadobacter sp. 3J3]